MADASLEQKLTAAPEQPPAPRPEEKPAPEQKPAREAPERAPVEKEQTPTPEAKTRMGELLHLKRRPKPAAIPQVRDETTVKIEKVLEEGIADAYSRLSPVAKQEFKLKGEEVSRKIREMVKTGHVKVKKIFRLILEWLKLLPGVNRFFLEQEAKIKTDRIIAFAKKDRH